MVQGGDGIMSEGSEARRAPYGARDGIGISHYEIARRLGLSVTRVQQLERRALEKLRKGLARAGFRMADR